MKKGPKKISCCKGFQISPSQKRRLSIYPAYGVDRYFLHETLVGIFLEFGTFDIRKVP